MMSQDNQIAARDTTFDGIIPKSVWILTRSSPDKKYIKIYLEVNGVEKEIDSVYVGNFDEVHSSSTQITWVIHKALDELKAENERLKNIIHMDSCNSPQARIKEFLLERDHLKSVVRDMVAAMESALPIIQTDGEDFEALRIQAFKSFNVHELDTLGMEFRETLAKHADLIARLK